MFQFTGFPSIRYVLAYGWLEFFQPGFPIQKSTDHRIFAPPRSLSQLITSFIGSQCQGIRPVLFLAWPFVMHNVALLCMVRWFFRISQPRYNLFLVLIKIYIKYISMSSMLYLRFNLLYKHFSPCEIFKVQWIASICYLSILIRLSFWSAIQW